MRSIITKEEIIKSKDFKNTCWLVIKNKKGEIIYNEFMENHTKRKMIDEIYKQILNNEYTEFVIDNCYNWNDHGCCLKWTVCEATVDITVEALLKLNLLLYRDE